MKIILPYETFFAEAFKDRLFKAIARGNKIIKTGDSGELELRTHCEVTISDIVDTVTAGGEVKDYPAWIKITTARFSMKVPEEISHYQKAVDGETSLVVRKWSEWTDGRHFPIQNIAKTYYLIGLNAFGEDLPGSQIKYLHETTGYTVLNTEQYKTLMVPGSGWVPAI